MLVVGMHVSASSTIRSPTSHALPVPGKPLLTPRAATAAAAASASAASAATISASPLPPTAMLRAGAAVSTLPPARPVPMPSRKRKILLDPVAETKRHRTWTELEHEEMLEEATLLREELEMLVAVATDLCRDLAIDPACVRVFSATLRQIEELMASTDDLTERQVRDMCQQMVTMMQYLCQRHFDHFALVDMQDHLRECRDRFMRFICKYAAMIGLFR